MATLDELLERIVSLEAQMKRTTGNLVEIYGMLEPEEESDEDDEVVEETPDPMFPITIDTVLTTLDASVRRFRAYETMLKESGQNIEAERAKDHAAMCKTARELLYKYKGRKIV